MQNASVLEKALDSMTTLKPIMLGTVLYTGVTFPLAVLWHVVLLKEHYIRFGYFEGDPSFLLGFGAILIQGALLSFLVLHLKLAGSDLRRCIVSSLIIGCFFWTSHVLAFVAKQQVPGALLFVSMETAYLAIQFGIYGVLMGMLLSKLSTPQHHHP